LKLRPLALLALVLGLGTCANILGIEEAVEGQGASCGAGGTCAGGASCLGGQCCPTPAAGGVCNIAACGCGTGQVCYPNDIASGLACYTSANLGAGQDCRGSVCSTGLGCFGSVCRPYCRTADDCPGPPAMRHCQATYWGDAAGTMIAGVNVCARMCDPLRPQSPRGSLLSCPAGFICDWSDTDGSSNCVPGGSGGEGAACTDQTSCLPSYYCSTTSNSCHKLCADSSDCGGLACLDFSPAVIIGNARVGYCARP